MVLAVIMSLICAIWAIALYRKIGKMRQDTSVFLAVEWIFAMMGTFMAWIYALCGS